MDRETAQRKYRQAGLLFNQGAVREAFVLIDELHAAFPRDAEIDRARSMILSAMQRQGAADEEVMRNRRRLLAWMGGGTGILLSILLVGAWLVAPNREEGPKGNSKMSQPVPINDVDANALTPAPARTLATANTIDDYRDRVHAISGGFESTNRVHISVGDKVFFENSGKGIGSAGLYVVAIHNGTVLIQEHYNTFWTPGASVGFAHDVEELPEGSLVIVAVKDEATRLFDQDGQDALYALGASQGLLNAPFRSSYLLLGAKGGQPDTAIEKTGMNEVTYAGSAADSPVTLAPLPEPHPAPISSTPGTHEGLILGGTEAIYYIPRGFDPARAEYLFCIHGAGAWHRPGALTHIDQFKDVADREKLVIVAPSFDPVFNWQPDWQRDMDSTGEWRDPKIVKHWHLHDFVSLINAANALRSDLKLIEIFEYFNENLMKRPKFHLYGHSGGGQFVIRFITYHPELVDKVAASSPGTFVFPTMEKDFPYGLATLNVRRNVGDHVNLKGLELGEAELTTKLNGLLDLRLDLIVGENEVEPGPDDASWQGISTLDKTRNYYEAMEREHRRQVDLGNRPESSTYQFRLHVLRGVGHDWQASGAAASRLMFPH